MPPERNRSFFLTQMDRLRSAARRVHYFVTRVTVSRQRSLRRYSQNFIDTWTRHLTWRRQKLVREAESLLWSSENGLLSEGDMKMLTVKLLRDLTLVFVDEETVDVRRLGGAMTNRVFVVSAPDTEPILLRLYGRGTDILFSRDRELETFKRLSDMSFGPKLLGTFRGGRLEEYIPSTTLTKTDLRDAGTSAEIAAVMARLHQATAPPAGEPSAIWDILQDWCGKARVAAGRVKDNVCAIQASDWNVRALVEDVHHEIAYMRTALERTPSPIVFCHNDAQYGNILRRRDDRQVMLIDYEYARFNYRGFDLGNHFCEWAADYDAADAHKLHFARYPTHAEQVHFVNAYLVATHPTFAQLSEAAQTAEREALVIEANRYGLLSHLMWCLWGVIQAAQSTIEFNFIEYSCQRFCEYRRRRDELLAAA